MNYITNYCGFWMQLLVKKFPEIFEKMPPATKVMFYYTHMSEGDHQIAEGLIYTFHRKWKYLSLKYKDTDGVERGYGFDLTKLVP